ncbi:hypothetical protein CP533_4400 [Ophiocordyceps camponoti-saundersi (nom. inval.)]|nr:hypothetical protein CP533_4400 [Ophiocordyceps camponoti-saundersi (nom. inval.)]
MKQFTISPVALLALATTTAHAASVTFWTLDMAQRTIYFTSNPGSALMAPVTVNASQNSTVVFPDNWAGNFYGVRDGESNKPGMLGEVQFSGWLGKTYFDVSAIVNGQDQHNVKQMWAKTAQTPMSGCEVFPCNNCYWLSDDIQTKVTNERDLMATLGTGSTGIAFALPHQEAPGSSQSHHAPQYQPSAQNPPSPLSAPQYQQPARPAVAQYRPAAAAAAAPQYQPPPVQVAAQMQPSQPAAVVSASSSSTESATAQESESAATTTADSEAQPTESFASVDDSASSPLSDEEPALSYHQPDSHVDEHMANHSEDERLSPSGHEESSASSENPV